jgi:hypothetical protein
MTRILDKIYIFKTKKRTIIILSLCFVLIVFSCLFPVGAAKATSIDEWVGFQIAKLMYSVIELLGRLLVAVINILTSVASYNHFIDATAVKKGWVIVRDVCNMLFIAILLLIASGTIFKWETYRYNRLLGRLILMAFLINFSKFICGFLIDIFQVLMLTFVNGFAETAAGNLTTGLGLYDMVKILGAGSAGALAGDLNVSAILGALMLAIIMLIIAIIVMAVMTVVFLYRIIMLWLLIILSPMAYFMRTYPGMGEGFSRQWWSMFGKYLISGPLLAFFLWLALIIMVPGAPGQSLAERENFIYTSTGEQQKVCSNNPEKSCSDTVPCAADEGECVDTMFQATPGMGAGTAQKFSATVTAIGQSDRILSFIISILLLMAALMFTQQLQVAGGRLAGEWSGKIGGALSRAGKMAAIGVAAGAPLAVAVAGRKRIAAGYNWMARKVYAGRVPGVGKYTAGMDIMRPWNVYRRVREARKVKAGKEESEGMMAAGSKMRERGGFRGAMFGLGTPDFAEQYMSGLFYNKGIKKLIKYRPKKLEGLNKEYEKKQREIEKLKMEENPDEYYHNYWKDKKKSAQDKIDTTQVEMDEPTRIESDIKRLQKGKKKAEGDGDIMKANDFDTQIKEKQERLEKIKKEPDRDRKLRQQMADARKELSNSDGYLQSFDKADYGGKDKMGRDLLQQQQKKYENEIATIAAGGQSEGQRKQTEVLLREIDKDIRKMTEDIKKKKEIDPKADTTADEAKLKEKEGEKTELEKYQATPEQQEENKKVLEGLKERTESFKSRAAAPYVAEHERKEKIEKAEAEAKQIKDEMDSISKEAPQDYYARSTARSAVNEEARKIDTTNEFELIDLFNNAMDKKDKFLAMAIAKRSTEVSHLNELINAAGFTAGQEGLNQLINQKFVKDLGINKQMAYSFQNDLGNIAQRVNHWNYAQSVGVKNGMFYQRPQEEQSERSFIEMSKGDPENMIRQGNRLMYGGEKSDGSFELGGQGLMMIRKFYEQMTKLIFNNRFNKNAAMKLVTDDAMIKMERLMDRDPTIEKPKFRKFMSDLKEYAAGSIDEVKKELAIVNDVVKGV